ncbi:UNVERIFIED_CONTAM: hypothetical protein K2H54_068316 [Gekko kuhli]
MHFLISNLAEMAGSSKKGVFWQEEELEVMYQFLHQHGYESYRPKRTCRQAALEESPGSSPHREAVSMESEVQSPETTAEQTSGEGEPSHSGSDQEQWRSEIKASLENITKKLMRINLLEIGMRRLQREFELRRLNEAVAAQAGDESGDEESEEAEEEERA